MITIKVMLALVLGVVQGREVGVPERFLRPRDFNPHPFLLEESPAGGSGIIPEVHPYHLFRRPNLRGEDDLAPVQFPKVPDSVPPQRNPPTQARNRPNLINAIQVQPLKRPHFSVAKNYAFSYTVRDHQSGDDFSHSQAHSGEATKGEYRVKLPDGRVQVVSYTADHRGYRADVRYDNEVAGHGGRQVPAYKQSSFKSPVLYKPAPTAIYKTASPSYKAVYYPVDYPDYEYAAVRPQKDYTPIHEENQDYPEAAPGPTAAPQAYYSPTPSYTASSPPPHYEEYHVVTTQAPAPAKFIVLPQHIGPIHS